MRTDLTNDEVSALEAVVEALDREAARLPASSRVGSVLRAISSNLVRALDAGRLRRPARRRERRASLSCPR